MTSQSNEPLDRGGGAGGGGRGGGGGGHGGGRGRGGGRGGGRGRGGDRGRGSSGLANSSALSSHLAGVVGVDRSSSITQSSTRGSASFSRGHGVISSSSSRNPDSFAYGSASSSTSLNATARYSAPRVLVPQFAHSREELPMDPIFVEANGIPISNHTVGTTSTTPQTSTAFGNPSYSHMAAPTPNNIPFHLLLEQEVPAGTYGSEKNLKRKAPSDGDPNGQNKRADIGAYSGDFQAHSHDSRRAKQHFASNGKTVEEQRRVAVAAEVENFYNGEPRGKDAPDGAGLRKVNEMKKVVMIYNCKNILQMDQTVVERGLKLKLGISNSQNPSLVVQTADYEIEKENYVSNDRKKSLSIFREHMGLFRVGNSEKILFKREFLAADNISAQNIFQMLTSEFNLNVSVEAAQDILDAVTADISLESGLGFFSIRLAAGSIIYSTTKLADKINDYTSRSQVNVVFIRDMSRYGGELDQFWDRQMLSCMDGAYPFYRRDLDDTQKLKFVDLHNRIVKQGATIDYPYWLAPLPKPVEDAKPNSEPIDDEDEKPVIISSCLALTTYEFLADMQFRPSIGLIRELQKTSKNNAKGFEVGRDYEMPSLSLASALSTKRRLQSVSWVSRWIPKSGPHFEIQQFLMGISNVSTRERLTLQCKDKKAVDLAGLCFLELGLNKAQKEVIIRVFTKNETGVLVQGLPGTGKTFTNSAIGIMCGLYKFNCLLSAPTNVATEALMTKLVGQYENIQKQPWGKEHNVGGIFDLIYFRSIATTRDMLLRKPAKDNFNKYEHASYIEKLIQADAGDLEQEATSQSQHAAREWLSLRLDVMHGGSVSPDKVETYLGVINAAGKRVFQRSSKPFVVVSTCNNAAQLKDWNVAVKVVTVDEVAFALEADVWICASLGPDRIVLTGDNAQVSPYVSSWGMNEHYAAIKQDAYTRLSRAYLLTTGEKAGKQVIYDVVTHLDTNSHMHTAFSRFQQRRVTQG